MHSAPKPINNFSLLLGVAYAEDGLSKWHRPLGLCRGSTAPSPWGSHCSPLAACGGGVPGACRSLGPQKGGQGRLPGVGAPQFCISDWATVLGQDPFWGTQALPCTELLRAETSLSTGQGPTGRALCEILQGRGWSYSF